MNVNNLCFSCECTISSVDLLWGRWGCLSPASKVLNASTYKCFHLHRNRVPSQRIQNTFLCSDSDRLNAIGRSIRGKLCCYWKRFSPTSYIQEALSHLMNCENLFCFSVRRPQHTWNGVTSKFNQKLSSKSNLLFDSREKKHKMELSIPGKRGLSSSSTEATPAKQIRETSSDAAKHLLKSSINVEPTHRLTSLKTSILPPVTSKFSTLTLTTNRHKSLLVSV